jgi:hypothetical protein
MTPNDPEQTDTKLIGNLVVEGRFKEAFEALPAYTRNVAIEEIRGGVRLGIRIAVWDMVKANVEEYQYKVLGEIERGNLAEAALLLVSHRDNADLFKKPETTPEESAPARGKSKVPYYPLDPKGARSATQVINMMIFSPSCERLAEEVFGGKTTQLFQWLHKMENLYQVPSEYDASYFVKEKVERLRKFAEGKLRQKPPMPLSHEESNAYYHSEKFEQGLVEEFKRRQNERSFGNLIEYVIVELLNQLKDRMRIKRVLKSSPEEDNFLGSDIVIETTEGLWCSVDLTVSESEQWIKTKEGHTQRNRISLPNLTAMLVSEDDTDEPERVLAVPMVQVIDRDLLTKVTKKYMESMKNGKREVLVDIFRRVAEESGKDVDDAETDLLSFAAAA